MHQFQFHLHKRFESLGTILLIAEILNISNKQKKDS